MTKAFVFAGNDTVGNMVADRLCGAGWQRVGDAGAADAVITFFTVQTALEDAYFGDNGIVTALIGRQTGDALDIELWIMSCRTCMNIN